MATTCVRPTATSGSYLHTGKVTVAGSYGASILKDADAEIFDFHTENALCPAPLLPDDQVLKLVFELNYAHQGEEVMTEEQLLRADGGLDAVFLESLLAPREAFMQRARRG